MTIWAQLPTDCITAALQGDTHMFSQRTAWDARHSDALNTALEDRTRLATALYRLVAAIQTEYPQTTVRMLQAQAAAIDVLQSVNGVKGTTEPTQDVHKSCMLFEDIVKS